MARKAMTDKRWKLAKVRLRNPAATLLESGRAAGYVGTDKSVASTVCRVLKTPAYQEAIREIMDRHPKLSRPALLDKLAEGLEAKVVHEGRETKAPDHTNRRGYLAMSFKMRGELVPDREDAPAVQVNIGAIVNLIRNESQQRGLDP